MQAGPSNRPPFVHSIGAFLREIAFEAERRGYKFDVRKIAKPGRAQQIRETRGQLDYEWMHLRQKLQVRSPEISHYFCVVVRPLAHTLFLIIEGVVR